MILTINDIFPVYKLSGNCLFSTSGDITLCYRMDLPEVYSLGESNMDEIHSDFFKFLVMLPSDCIVHKQDVYLEKAFSGVTLPQTSFLEKATKNYFKGRGYLEHNSFLFITLSHFKSLERDFVNSTFLKKDLIYKEDTRRVQNFSRDTSNAISTLNSSPLLKAIPLEEEVTRELLFLYFNGFEMGKLTDIEFKPDFKIGGNFYHILALNNEANQPENITNCKVDLTMSTDKYTFYKFLTQGFGLDVNCNHIVNQIIYVDDHREGKKELEKKVDEFNRFSKFSPGNEANYSVLNGYLKSVEQDEKIKLARGHFNVIFWANDKARLTALENEFVTKFREIDVFPYSASYIDFVYYFLGCVPGSSGMIPKQETFHTDLGQATCYFNFVTGYKSDPKGIVFNERLYNLPVLKDTWDEPYRTKQIGARNFAVVAETGGGKSVLTNHLFRQFIEQDYSLMLCDVGDSYEGLARLYKDKIAYIKYREGRPLGINPFRIGSERELDSEKTKNLSEFVFIHWKKALLPSDSERVSMNMLISDYYKHCPSHHSFPDFYKYVKDDRSILKRLDINPDFFNIEEFIHVCSEYVTGIYDFLYDDLGEVEGLNGKQAAIFELSDAFNKPDILPLMFLMIRDTIDSKIWNNTGSRKVLVYEEAAKLFEFPSMLTAMNYTAQTVRKYDGGMGTIVQSIDNFPDNEIGKALLNNTHIFYVFEPKKGIASLKEKLNLSVHDINQLLSVRSNLSGKHPYTEFGLILGSRTNCLRLELPREAFYAYLSEKGDKRKIFLEAEKAGSYEQAIINMIAYEQR